ncbi:MAG: DEAD/DEAH box helicase [Vicingaceae bacterium]
MNFKQLGLIDPILRALDTQGYTQPTPIQEQAIPILLEKKDLLGCAQTGTGKTAAFTLPIIQHLYAEVDFKQKRQIKALIITPTRELALQINDNIKAYAQHTKLRHTVIFGGVKQGKQTRTLAQGVDILVATPGRLLDLIGQGFITLKHIQYFVLDEADQMLDMGFIHDIKKVINQLPQKRQSLFFSATMAPAIVDLSKQILGNPERVTIKPQQTTAEKVEQSVFMVAKADKIKLLTHVINSKAVDTSLVFSRTKHGANKVVKKLDKAGIKAEAIHGNKSQNARVKALEGFKNGQVKVLVATDIAARGIDVEELDLVVNYDLPNVPETYVHRIGRTGRAEASGEAISFCDVEERPYLHDIEKLIKTQITKQNDHPFVDERPDLPPEKKSKSKPRSSNSRNRKRNNFRRKKKENS